MQLAKDGCLLRHLFVLTLCCGFVSSMGAFLNSQEQVCYGLNDFDESVIGDYQ